MVFVDDGRRSGGAPARGAQRARCALGADRQAPAPGRRTGLEGFASHSHCINIECTSTRGRVCACSWSAMENKTARLTLLLDPRKKALLEEICAAKDVTPSQVVRQLIREYIIENAGDRPLPRWLLAASKKTAARR